MALIATKSSKLPSVGKALDIYYLTDTRETYLVAADGVLLNARDILQGTTNPVRAVGPQGQPGRDGASITGPRGEKGDRGEPGESITGPRGHAGQDGQSIVGPQGERGPAGHDGKDSTTPGPRGERGESIIGPQGPKGDPGDISVVGDAELHAAVQKLRAQKAAALAKIITNTAAMGTSPVYRLVRMHLEEVRKELEQ
jgi:hypothetical protein